MKQKKWKEICNETRSGLHKINCVVLKPSTIRGLADSLHLVTSLLIHNQKIFLFCLIIIRSTFSEGEDWTP